MALAPGADPAPIPQTRQDGEAVKMFTAMAGRRDAVRDFQECRGAR